MKNNKLNIILHSINSMYIPYIFNYMNTFKTGNFGSEDKCKVIMGIFFKLERYSAISLKLF